MFLPATREVTVGEVVRNLESQLELVECFDERSNTCPITSFCRLAPALKRASVAFLRELDQVRVGDLVARPSELRSAFRPAPPGDKARGPGGRRSR